MFMSVNEISTAILLVALGLGYIVCYLAQREEKTLKVLGYAIGTFMVALSILIILSNAILMSQGCRKMEAMSKQQMSRHKQMMMQKMMQQMPAAKEQAPAAIKK